MPVPLGVLLAFVPALLATPWVAARAARLGLVDVPSGRSSHARPVPRTGGIGVFVGLMAGAVAAWFLAGIHGGWAAYLLPAGAYFTIGLLDDRFGLGPRPKFLGQAAAAILAVALGLRWSGAGLGPFGALEFGALTPFMTWLWLVAVVTLVNFMDGIDLITASVCAVMLAVAAGAGAGPGGGVLYALALGALLGMAFWNVSPARVFPGDAGTHLLGFLVASVACELPASDGAGATGLPWALASGPLLASVVDVGGGLWTKARHGVSLAQAHNDHLYQRLTKAGGSHVTVALRYGALALAGAVIIAQVAPRFGLAACIVAGALVLALHLGHGLRATRGVPYASAPD